ncbi:hypothetical protein IVB34_47685 [Bradyrhizobium sp. 2]|uniref:hypothetical protein n=1 Tax=unclassified Bradyrhizobium TaxID=2631580 RepID=UPI001FFA866A|nr:MULTISPECIES: hypothetical protein [unclassified Bradyrhizobium]MCK1465771.1 hypothetical protein [Bradyrhizobium sp. 2]MCK1520222.1 hypothetical protein [Bradyrhizobium sp. 17]
MRIRIPPIDVAAIDPATGRFVADWYDVIKGLEKLGLLDLADVSTTAPANGQVLIYSSANKNFAPGAN